MTMKNENEKSCILALVHDTVYVDGSDYSKKKKVGERRGHSGVFHMFAEPSTIDHRINPSNAAGRDYSTPSIAHQY
jgi:hypothetical protein